MTTETLVSGNVLGRAALTRRGQLQVLHTPLLMFKTIIQRYMLILMKTINTASSMSLSLEVCRVRRKAMSIA